MSAEHLPFCTSFTVLHSGHLYPHFNGWDIFFHCCPLSAASTASFKEIAVTYGYCNTQQWWWEFTALQKWHEYQHSDLLQKYELSPWRSVCCMAFENHLDCEKFWNGNIENGKQCLCATETIQLNIWHTCIKCVVWCLICQMSYKYVCSYAPVI